MYQSIFIHFHSTSIRIGVRSCVISRKYFNVSSTLQCKILPLRQVLTHLSDIEDTVDKFSLRPHFKLNAECTGATWLPQQQLWEVGFIDTTTKEKFTRTCKILLTAVGGFAIPRDIKFPGLESFGGQVFHTAQWDHSCDYRGKRVAVIGNGCSAAQVVPSIAKQVSKLTQYVLLEFTR